MAAGRRTHVARFVDGPRDRQTADVPAMESGQAPEIVLTPGRPEWLYVRAGAPWPDGSLPYLYMPPSRVAWNRSRNRRAIGPPAG
jgi:hypothetical protein